MTLGHLLSERECNTATVSSNVIFKYKLKAVQKERQSICSEKFHMIPGRETGMLRRQLGQGLEEATHILKYCFLI